MEFAKEAGKFLAGLPNIASAAPHHGTWPRSPSPQAGNFAEQDGALCSDFCLYTMKVARRFCLQHGLSWWPAL